MEQTSVPGNQSHTLTPTTQTPTPHRAEEDAMAVHGGGGVRPEGPGAPSETPPEAVASRDDIGPSGSASGGEGEGVGTGECDLDHAHLFARRVIDAVFAGVTLPEAAHHASRASTTELLDIVRDAFASHDLHRLAREGDGLLDIALTATKIRALDRLNDLIGRMGEERALSVGEARCVELARRTCIALLRVDLEPRRRATSASVGGAPSSSSSSSAGRDVRHVHDGGEPDGENDDNGGGGGGGGGGGDAGGGGERRSPARGNRNGLSHNGAAKQHRRRSRQGEDRAAAGPVEAPAGAASTADVNHVSEAANVRHAQSGGPGAGAGMETRPTHHMPSSEPGMPHGARLPRGERAPADTHGGNESLSPSATKGVDATRPLALRSQSWHRAAARRIAARRCAATQTSADAPVEVASREDTSSAPASALSPAHLTSGGTSTTRRGRAALPAKRQTAPRRTWMKTGRANQETRTASDRRGRRESNIMPPGFNVGATFLEPLLTTTTSAAPASATAHPP